MPVDVFHGGENYNNLKLQRFFVCCDGVREKFAARSHWVFLILGDKAKKMLKNSTLDVEISYTCVPAI